MKQEEKRRLPNIKINRLKELERRLGVPLSVLKKISENPELHYHSWTKEKNGKKRTFHQADPALEAIHQKLNEEIFERFDFPIEFQGGIKERSLRSNALLHSGKKNIATFDIKQFFPSVRPARVYRVLVSLGCQPDVARMITRLVTADRCLPQGYKTSPYVAALILLPIRKRLLGLTEKHGVTPSFWIDDLTLSGSYPLKDLKPSVKKIFRQAGFVIHKDESSPTYNNKRQVVTGTVVNAKPSVKKETRLAAEKAVFLAEKNGLRWYKRNHAPELGLVKLGRKITGRIANMNAIDKEKYEPLRKRWEKVLEKAGVEI